MATFPILRNSPAALRRRPAGAKPTNLTLFPTAARHGNSEICSDASTPPPSPDRRKKPAEKLVGIARLAASSPCADAKRGTEYFVMPVKSILNECHSERVPFRWTVNPYRGCEFGCKYCYARYTHEYMEIDGNDFESKIYMKEHAAELADRDLAHDKVWGEHIAIGTATDPYQPAEAEFQATRKILEKVAEREGLRLSITTKSNRVLRDIDVLQRIASRSELSVNLSITTVHAPLARLLEPRAPRPDLRFEAVHRLRDAGIAAGVLAMPVVPGLTDRPEDLGALARSAKDAGAMWFAARVLFLMPASWKTMIAFIDEKYPKLSTQYREWYQNYGDAPEAYRKKISSLVEKLRRKYELGTRPDRGENRAWKTPQLQLAFR